MEGFGERMEGKVYSQQIQYIDYYQDGQKVKNAGFLKLIQDGDVQKITLQVDKLPDFAGEYPVFLIPEINVDKPVMLGKIHMEGGGGYFQTLQSAGKYYEDVVIKIYLGGGLLLESRIHDYLLQNTNEVFNQKTLSWKEQEIGVVEVEDNKPDEAEIKEAEEKAEAMKQEEMLQKEEWTEDDSMLQENMEGREVKEAEEKGTIQYMEIREGGRREKQKKDRKEYAMAENKWDQLWELYPHKAPFEDRREYLVLAPGDFVILQKDCYNLVKNSFLLHGYSTYKYLIIWKNRVEGEERYYVGVPGRFYDKECQAAVYFGFESFEGKEEPPREGDFGFYMKRVYL